MESEKEIGTELFGCTSCGADLTYKPGTVKLKCEYCGAENDIPQIDELVEELDFENYLNTKVESEDSITEKFIKCNGCGASSSFPKNVTSTNCPYCSTPLILDQAKDEKLIQPKSLLPFKINQDESKSEVKKWISKLWFAPNDLQKAVLNFEQFKGIYIPYWTFDLDTYSDYTGQRGQYYYVKSGDKKVRKTRWYPASGRVTKFFDDILTPASKSLPEKYINKLEPWDLENLVPYDKNYLSGFVTEKYQVDLKEGFEISKSIADDKIRDLVRRDIGGDTQRIYRINTTYNDISFKHLLLPVYVSSFKYKNKAYQFLVNGRTAEVQGERPYSWVKILLTILVGLIVVGAIYYWQY